jgi:hypothetical protein
MKRQSVFLAIAAGFLALLLAQQQPSHAQYGDSGVGVSEETLQKCNDLDIPITECSDSMVVLKERMNSRAGGGGSGTPMIATESGQMILFIGLIGAIFGSVAAGFYVMGRKPKAVKSI